MRIITYKAHIDHKINHIRPDILHVIAANIRTKELTWAELHNDMEVLEGMYQDLDMESQKIANDGGSPHARVLSRRFEGRSLLEQLWYIQGLVRDLREEIDRGGCLISS
jgi:hypothetical protein